MSPARRGRNHGPWTVPVRSGWNAIGGSGLFYTFISGDALRAGTARDPAQGPKTLCFQNKDMCGCITDGK